jgi:NADH-quinone oxidoreductase subunit N
MHANMFQDYLSVLPEIVLALSGMFFLMVGLFQGNTFTRTLSWSVAGIFFIVFVLNYLNPSERNLILGGLFVIDSFALFTKSLILAGAFLALILSMHYFYTEQEECFEFPILVLFAVLGMLVMVSANDLMSMYIGLELQSLCLYVLAAIRRDSLKATESGVKYFVLGAISSGILLYGASLVYGYTGSTNFSALSDFFTGATLKHPPLGLLIGVIMILVGLGFKVAAAPFHMWAPDVYEGAPSPVTAFFAIAPKIAGIALLIRVLMGPFGALVMHWQQVVVVMSLLSIIIGALGALQQYNLKRLLAYSSIGHTGYLLLGIASGVGLGVKAVLLYLFVYMFMVVGIFAIILSLRYEGKFIQEINDLKGLSRTHPRLSLCMAILMFSMAGIPPLAGFFGKFYILMSVLEAGLVWPAIIAVIGSVIAAFYYLRIIKVMYFDEPLVTVKWSATHAVAWVVIASSIITVLFFLIPGWIMGLAGVAAQSLVSL